MSNDNMRHLFALFLGANTIHDSDGKFVRMEHTFASRQLSAQYRADGTTAWKEFCKKHARNTGDNT